MSNLRSVALIFNPMSGRRRAPVLVSQVLEVLDREGCKVTSVPTDAPGAATSLAAELAASGKVDAVFALGGDGTIREVAIGLMGTPVPLGPLPGGTTNVLVKSLGLSSRAGVAAGQLTRGGVETWRVGMCGRTPFLMMVSAGYDAEVVQRMDGGAKAKWGRLAVAALGLSSWWSFGFPRFDVIHGGEQLKAHFAVVSNIPQYGGSFVLAPKAHPSHPQLELTVHSAAGRRAALGFASDLVLGRHLERKDVVQKTVDSVRLDGPPNLPLQVDGDLCKERLPVEVRVAPDPLQVLVP